MSARDDYPDLANAAENGPCDERRALDEIDRLRLDAGYLDDIARTRGEENERLRDRERKLEAVVDAARELIIHWAITRWEDGSDIEYRPEENNLGVALAHVHAEAE